MLARGGLAAIGACVTTAHSLPSPLRMRVCRTCVAWRPGGLVQRSARPSASSASDNAPSALRTWFQRSQSRT